MWLGRHGLRDLELYLDGGKILGKIVSVRRTKVFTDNVYYLMNGLCLCVGNGLLGSRIDITTLNIYLVSVAVWSYTWLYLLLFLLLRISFLIKLSHVS